MTPLHRYRVAIALILLAFVGTGLVYSQLPDLMPMQWGLDGRVNSYFPKWWAAWIVPVVAAVATAAMMNLFNAKRSSTLIVNAFAAFMLFSCGVIWYSAMHPSESPLAYLFAGLGVFLIVIGNIAGKLTWNYFVGIRTPWTLDDPKVWERTHRAAGPVFVVGGLVMFGAGIAHAPAAILLALLLATCLYPTLYSYRVWRRG